MLLAGDGGCANYASENVADVTVAGSAVAGSNPQFKQPLLPNASSYCIAGVDTMEAGVFRNVNVGRC